MSPSVSKESGTCTVIMSFEPISTYTEGERVYEPEGFIEGALFTANFFSIIHKCINSVAR